MFYKLAVVATFLLIVVCAAVFNNDKSITRPVNWTPEFYEKFWAEVEITPEAVEMLKRFEGYSSVAYRDNERPGIWTIGWGNTQWENGTAVRPGDKIDRVRAEFLLRSKLKQFEAVVHHRVKVPLNANEFSALVLFTYNVGPGGLQKSMLLRRLNAGDRYGAADGFLRFVKVDGKVVAGLERRRRMERRLFLTPVTL